MRQTQPTSQLNDEVVVTVIQAVIADSHAAADDTASFIECNRDARPGDSYSANELLTLGLACRLFRLENVTGVLPDGLPSAGDLIDFVFGARDKIPNFDIHAAQQTYLRFFVKNCLWSLVTQDAARTTVVASGNDEDRIIDSLSEFLLASLS